MRSFRLLVVAALAAAALVAGSAAGAEQAGPVAAAQDGYAGSSPLTVGGA